MVDWDTDHGTLTWPVASPGQQHFGIRILLSLQVIIGLLFTNFSIAQSHPNIIFIFIDDMGYSDLSCFGNKEMKMPNIDHLAKEGIRFTNYYDNSPICSPSRVAAITGSYPSRVLRERRYKLIYNIANAITYPSFMDLYNSYTWQWLLNHHLNT